MIYVGGLLGVAAVLLWVFCIVDILTAGGWQILPRPAWLVLVLLVPVLGALLWFTVGRPRPAGVRPQPLERPAPRYPEYDRPGRFAALDAETDEEFLRRCRERAEQQRRRAQGEPDV